MPAIAAVGAAVTGILLGLLLGVMITIKKPDGTAVTLQAPSGSTVVVDDQGNAEVQLAGGTANSAVVPNASPKIQTMKEVTVQVDQAFIDGYKPGDLVNVVAAYEKSHPFIASLKSVQKVDSSKASLMLNESEFARLYDIKGGFSKAELKKLRDKILPNKDQMEEDSRQATDHLRQLTLVCLNYAADHGHFPASKNLHKESGKFHSWRVAILPYLDQQELYDQYRFDEQWDSPLNSKLLKRMPRHFRHPSADRNSTTTNYVGFADAKTALGIEKGHRLQDFKDGTSNTLLLIEADSQIPWTKPEDLPFNNQTLEKLHKNFKRHTQASYSFSKADGSVHSIKNADMPPAKLKALITRSGGDDADGR